MNDFFTDPSLLWAGIDPYPPQFRPLLHPTPCHLTFSPRESITGVVVDPESTLTEVTLQTPAVEEHALCTHSLHDVHSLLTEVTELALWLGGQQNTCGLLQQNDHPILSTVNQLLWLVRDNFAWFKISSSLSKFLAANQSSIVSGVLI